MDNTNNTCGKTIDIEQFKLLCNDFSAITGLTICLEKKDDCEIFISQGRKPPCEHFFKKNTTLKDLCTACDTCKININKALAEQEAPIINRCKYGLVSAHTPVIINETLSLSLCLGQAFLETPNLSEYEALAQKYNFDLKVFLSEIKAIPVVTEKELLNNILFLSKIIQWIAETDKKNQAQLTANHKLLNLQEAALANIPDMLWFKDTENRYAFVNEAYRNILQRPLKEIIGYTDLEIQRNKELAQKYSNDDKTVLETHQRLMFEELFEEPDGTTRHIEVYKTPLFNNNQELIGTIGIARNVSERVKMRQKLTAQNQILKEKEQTLEFQNVQLKEKEQLLLEQNKELNSLQEELKTALLKEEQANQKLIVTGKQKDKFLSIMSHEIRTPLNSVIGFTELLRTEYFGTLNERQLEYLTLIQGSSEHLLTLISDILDISRIEIGNYDLNLARFEIDAFLEELLASMETPFKNKSILLIQTKMKKDVYIIGDQAKYKQIILNLLSNALKYTNSKGIVEIKTELIDDNHIKIMIIDNGIGINKENLDKIFDEFYQIRHSHEDVLIGAGIGLTLTKKLVELHQGDIGVISELDKGSTFWIVMPLEPK